jgi:hypothetical protein
MSPDPGSVRIDEVAAGSGHADSVASGQRLVCRKSPTQRVRNNRNHGCPPIRPDPRNHGCPPIRLEDDRAAPERAKNGVRS